MTDATEVNFDGLVGPTHNYAGLSVGNRASTRHRGLISNPREAALQGLAKAKHLADLGLPQAILPPHERPLLPALRQLGFGGSDAQLIAAVARQAPHLLAACSSASAMWVANAATVTPSADSADQRVHLTPANLVSKFHRSLEPAQTTRILRALFADESRFAVHEPLPGAQGLGDEGAANHTRLAPAHGEAGVHLFAHGHTALAAASGTGRPRRYSSRHARESSEAVARLHQLDARRVVHARQHPAAIDAGVFHNDVIATGNESLFLHHELAFTDTPRVLRALRKAYRETHPGQTLLIVPVPARKVSLTAAIRSYLFNSQLVTVSSDRMTLIAPQDCAETPSVRRFLDELIARGETPLKAIHYLDLRQSMRNGGGPACLRLRVVLTTDERRALPPTVMLTAQTYPVLVAWVKKHYRPALAPADLADPSLLEESRRALDELTQLLNLGSLYPFQSERSDR